MIQILQQFELYLKNDRGFSTETIVKYLCNLKIMFKKLQLKEVSQLKSVVINKKLLDEFWSNFMGGKRIASDSTRANYLCALKSFLKFCYVSEYIKENISEKIQMPKKRLLYLEGLNRKEQQILRDYIASHLKNEMQLRDAAFIMFMWATAARVSEVLSLKCHPDSFVYFHDENLRSGDFHLSEGQVYVHISGKGKKNRVIAVSNDALHYLNLYLDNRKRKNEILFHTCRNNRSNSIKLTRAATGFIVTRMLDNAGISKPRSLRTHIFRHTAINNWLEMNYTKEEIIRITGHAGISGLDSYDRRNKRLTIPFAHQGKSTIDVSNNELKQIENINKIRYSPQY